MKKLEKFVDFIFIKGVLSKMLLICLLLMIIFYIICMPVSKEILYETIFASVIMSLFSAFTIVMAKTNKFMGYKYKELSFSQKLSQNIAPFFFVMAYVPISIIFIILIIFQKKFEMACIFFPTVWSYYFGGKTYYICKKYKYEDKEC